MGFERLQTPCLLLDRKRFEANLDRLRARAIELGVRWRPHLKTSKSVDAGEAMRRRGVTGGTVSTLAEAAAFMDAGWTDLVYAVPLTPTAIERGVALLDGRADDALQFLVESVSAARAAAHAAARHGRTLAVWIEIDCGAGRTGVSPDGQELLAVADALAPGVRLAGVLTHAGQSYAAGGRAELVRIAETERRAAVAAAERLRARGHDVPAVSVGSTPTALAAEHLEGIDEFRPGVGVLFDLYQHGLGVCTTDEIAADVLTRVIAVHPDERRCWVDAGSLAMSADRSAGRFDPAIGWGRIVDPEGRPLAGVRFETAHQEHGFLRLDSLADPADFPVGRLLRILPNHACITAAMHDRFHVHEGGAPRAVWERVRGW